MIQSLSVHYSKVQRRKLLSVDVYNSQLSLVNMFTVQISSDISIERLCDYYDVILHRLLLSSISGCCFLSVLLLMIARYSSVYCIYGSEVNMCFFDISVGDIYSKYM